MKTQKPLFDRKRLTVHIALYAIGGITAYIIAFFIPYFASSALLFGNALGAILDAIYIVRLFRRYKSTEVAELKLKLSDIHNLYKENNITKTQQNELVAEILNAFKDRIRDKQPQQSSEN